MKGGARSLNETCRKDDCNATVSTRIVKRNGKSVEIKQCDNGHPVGTKTLDADGSTFDAFLIICGP